MKAVKIKYPRVMSQEKIGDKLFVLETIRDLDEAIDLLCEAIPKDEHWDPFSEDLCPYFGFLWPSAIALSQYLFQNPGLVKGRKILELGCGLGLPSMVASHLGGVVLATDFHPDVEEYFLRNCRHSSVGCDYQKLNWRDTSSSVGTFDLVMGSDVLYESKHPEEVAKGLLRFVRPEGKIVLSDPGRAYLHHFIQAIKSQGLKEKMSVISIKQKDIFIFECSSSLNECTE